jgi:hypothetical protein
MKVSQQLGFSGIVCTPRVTHRAAERVPPRFAKPEITNPIILYLSDVPQ